MQQRVAAGVAALALLNTTNQDSGRLVATAQVLNLNPKPYILHPAPRPLPIPDTRNPKPENLETAKLGMVLLHTTRSKGL